ncbi:Serine/threonine-protein kinase D [Bacillus sp. THAF10]|uniref:protein kinase domain-containing protein n=1 Tax=Bacillus sp. THAF10 TaxID=2587848 RepID=UPI001268257F|nr:serine/threonine-protein kinase [Bacillus sp. THAF10]QFT87139.1 Serine/threonine-protein kinase D [Bacillus sp. THAF10]
MMNNSMKNSVANLPKGTVLLGKWHNQSYTVWKTLGYGATGYVYLTKGPKGFAALKISENSTSITSEVNVLRHFSKVQGFSLGPSLLDVDDWEMKGTNKTYSFYVMEYLEGESLHIFLQKRGMEWAGILILQLLTDLQTLHNEGWVFGDLKPDNLIVTSSPPKIRLLDVGGTTLNGRAIKEFTEFFDRGYWGLGSRKADSAYDLFAVAMIMIHICYPKQFQKNGQHGLEQLRGYIRKNSWLMQYEPVLVQALTGRYPSAETMKKEMLSHMSQKKSGATTSTTKAAAPNSAKKTQSVKGKGSLKHHQASVATNTPSASSKKGWMETAVLLSIVLFAYFFYLYGQMM